MIKNKQLILDSIKDLGFLDSHCEVTKSGLIKFTLVFNDNKILIISKEIESIDEDIIYSFFINRKLISGDVVNIHDFIKGFKKYIK